MPRRKKPARELTDEEAAKRLFPARVLRAVKKEAHKHDEDGKKKPAKKK